MVLEQIHQLERPPFQGTSVAIFDLDGPLFRWPQYAVPNQADQASFFEQVGRLRQGGMRLSVLTNRSAAGLQLLAYQLGEKDGWWITESGGCAYNITDHKTVVLPQWQEYAKYEAPRLRGYLENRLGIAGYSIVPTSLKQAQFEPGQGFVKTVIVPPEESAPGEYYQQILKPALADYKGLDTIDIKVGKAIDIDPVGLSKGYGMEQLLLLNNIDPQKNPAIFIADADRDIEAGEVLARKGGWVGAVGNSSSEFIRSVSLVERGIVAPDTTSYHSSSSWILDEFLQRIHG